MADFGPCPVWGHFAQFGPQVESSDADAARSGLFAKAEQHPKTLKEGLGESLPLESVDGVVQLEANLRVRQWQSARV